jgi:glucose-1-phosphate adenylyltransferase
MGIYAFKADFLYQELHRNAAYHGEGHDFGKDIIPNLVERGRSIYAHRFNDSCVNMVEGVPYWRDVGTIDAYWEANIALTKVTPDLNLYDREWPIWTYQEQLPPAKFVFDDDGRRGLAVDSMVSGGDIISGAVVRRSVLFSNVRALEGSRIEDSVVLPDVVVGRNVVLKRAVVDRYCKLPDGFSAGVNAAEDRKTLHVTDKGITLIAPEMLDQYVHHVR